MRACRRARPYSCVRLPARLEWGSTIEGWGSAPRSHGGWTRDEWVKAPGGQVWVAEANLLDVYPVTRGAASG